MSKLTREQKQEILDKAPKGAEYYSTAKTACGIYYYGKINGVMHYYSPQVNYFIRSVNSDEWHERYLVPLADFHEDLALPSPPRLTYLINTFKAEFPYNFGVIGGYSKADFDNEVLAMSHYAGKHAFNDYVEAVTAPVRDEHIEKNAAELTYGDLCNHTYLDGILTYLCKHPAKKGTSFALHDKQGPVEVTTSFLTKIDTDAEAKKLHDIFCDALKIKSFWKELNNRSKDAYRNMIIDAGVRLPESK